MRKLFLLILLFACTYVRGQRAKISNDRTIVPVSRTYAIFNSSTLAALRMTITNNGLTATHTAGGDGSTKSTYAITGTTAIYVEFTIGQATGLTTIGICKEGAEVYDLPGRNAIEWAYRNDGQKMNGGTNAAYGASWTAGDVISLLLDLNAGTLVFYKNGSTQGTAYSSLSGTFWIKVGADDSGSPQQAMTVNFGASAFVYSVPGGYLSGLYLN